MKSYRQLRLFGILAVVLIGFGLAISWVLGHGFIDITVANAKLENVTYTLSDLKNNTSTTITGGSHLHKLVHNGDYQITASIIGQNAWQPKTSVDGLLSTTNLSLTLDNEIGRSFVGNNPAPCMYYTGSILLSHECNSDGGLSQHVAATGSTPTYVQNVAGIPDNIVVVGITRTGQGNVMITAVPDVDSGTSLLFGSILDSNGIPGTPTALKGVDSEQTYSLTTYHSGFLLYTNDLRSVLYFGSINAQPAILNLTEGNQGYTATNIEATDFGIVASFSAASGEDTGAVSAAPSIITTSISGKLTHYSLPFRVSKAAFCGSNLCVLTEKRIYIFERQGSDLVEKNRIVDGQDLVTSGITTYLITGGGVLSYNDHLPDHYLYTVGTYTSCGLSVSGGVPVLCLITTQHNKVALLLGGPLSGYPIDVSLSQLMNSGAFDAVSAYRQYIYLTPRVKSTYQTSYSDTDRDRSSHIIKQKVEAAHLDSEQYTVVNTVTY